MKAQTTISITEARKRIFDIAEKVQNPSVYYVLTEKGRPKAVVLSAEEFESWVETLEIVNDFPQLKNDLMHARVDYEHGDFIPLRDYLSNNAISSRTAKKGTKRSR